jgi:hypothetical protein
VDALGAGIGDVYNGGREVNAYWRCNARHKSPDEHPAAGELPLATTPGTEIISNRSLWAHSLRDARPVNALPVWGRHDAYAVLNIEANVQQYCQHLRGKHDVVEGGACHR